MNEINSIRIKNIYYMIAYAFRSLRINGSEETETEKFDNIYNLFAAVLAEETGCLLKRGLYREYTAYCEDLPLMRGKLDMSGTIKNRISRRQMLKCQFDELSENNQLNQILKASVLLLMRVPDVNPDYKDKLKKQMMFFSDVDSADLSAVRWSDIRYSRNSRNYYMLMGICQLISECLIMTQENGDIIVSDFIDDQHMSILYERFILEYYRRHFPGLSVSDSAIPWSLDGGTDDALLPEMRSDIMLRKNNDILVIDAGYHENTLHTEHNRISIDSGDVYQIFTYVKNLEYELGNFRHTVSGMILYAGTDEPVQPENDYNMKGNRISVRTLDLDQHFSKIADQLDSIAYEYFEERPSFRIK